MLFFPDMEKGFHGEGESLGHEQQESDVELKERLEELNRLLARLCETGGELPSYVKQGLRSQIQGLVHILGMKSLEDYAGWAKLYRRLYEPLLNLPEPKNYPTIDECKARLQELYQIRHPEDLPPVPNRPRATHLSRFALADWSEINGRGGVGVVDYIFELGKMMSSESAYSTIFDETDMIEVGERWNVENGRHRALTLRVLGPEFVDEQGMDDWVMVRKE